MKGGSLAIAVESPSEIRQPPVSWSDVLGYCTTLDACGCALAWCLANGCEVSQVHDTVFTFRDFFTTDMKHGMAHKRAIFPMRVGGFKELLENLRRVRFTDSVSPSFQELWSQTAWTMLSCAACQSLACGHSPFLEGAWTALDKRLVAAVELSVQRMRSHGHAEVLDPGAVEKELKKRRVSYEGEEVGVWHVLSLEQIEPALPPREHGGTISVLDFVSNTTREFLEAPEKLLEEDVGQPLPKLQGKIHAGIGEMKKIAVELVQRGVCSWISLEDVVEYRNEKVLNG